MAEHINDVIILGSGPAGLTAAIYTARAELNPLVISGNSEGGQLMITTDVENYPGFSKGILGPDLINEMRQQAKKFGTEFITADVDKVDFSKRPFTLHLDNGKEYQAQSVIIATGASARLLGLPSEKEYMGYGVSACATCDGFFFKNKEVIVVGGGDSAVEEAIFLTKFASKVTVAHRRDELRASKIMQEKAFNNSKIDFIWDTVVQEIIGEKEEKNGIVNKKVTGVKLYNKKSDEMNVKEVDGVFIAIGHTPNTKLFKDYLPLDDKGYIRIKENTSTNIEGVFACGDVIDSYYRQAITAAGSGCKAAIDVEKWLER
jgi:thioredoxin reductase (NADPH)